MYNVHVVHAYTQNLGSQHDSACCFIIIGVSRSKLHIITQTKNHCTYLCMYVCAYVAIHRPCAHHVRTYRVCMQIGMVKIVSVDCVLTRNVAHQTTEERFFEAQADLD